VGGYCSRKRNWTSQGQAVDHPEKANDFKLSSIGTSGALSRGVIDGNTAALDRYLGAMDADDALNDAAFAHMFDCLEAHESGREVWGEPEEVEALRAAVESETVEDWAREAVIEESNRDPY